jgi:hypothetical protein
MKALALQSYTDTALYTVRAMCVCALLCYVRTPTDLLLSHQQCATASTVHYRPAIV